jgi:hypothetical protein
VVQTVNWGFIYHNRFFSPPVSSRYLGLNTEIGILLPSLFLLLFAVYFTPLLDSVIVYECAYIYISNIFAKGTKIPLLSIYSINSSCCVFVHCLSKFIFVKSNALCGTLPFEKNKLSEPFNLQPQSLLAVPIPFLIVE